MYQVPMKRPSSSGVEEGSSGIALAKSDLVSEARQL